MGYLCKGNYMLLWGTVQWDATLRNTQKGKNVASFAVNYDRRHNVDGVMENVLMNISIWGDDALFIGHSDIGVSKGDKVIVCGKVVEDTFYREGEDRSVKKYKVNADIVVDSTSIFQLMQMVVVDGIASPESPNEDDDAPDVSKVEDIYEGTPFDDDELPL